MNLGIDVINELISAENARDEMLNHLTRAYVLLDRAPNERGLRNAVSAARDVAFVDGDGGPLPDMIVAAVLLAAEFAVKLNPTDT